MMSVYRPYSDKMAHSAICIRTQFTDAGTDTDTRNSPNVLQLVRFSSECGRPIVGSF